MAFATVLSQAVGAVWIMHLLAEPISDCIAASVTTIVFMVKFDKILEKQ